MGYSKENTIVIWTDDKYLSGMTKKIAKELRLSVLEAEVESDIYGYPYFFAIIDNNKMNNSILINLTELLSSENPMSFGILLTSKLDFAIPGEIEKLFLIPPQRLITFEWLKTTITNKHYYV